MEKLNCIKICMDPHCDAVFHNIPKSITRCLDCNGRLLEINLSTYFKKFQDHFFQYDYPMYLKTDGNITKSFLKIEKPVTQLQFDFK